MIIPKTLSTKWNGNRSTITPNCVVQVEDIYNILSVKYPHFNFLLLLDQSSGHGKMRKGTLNVNNMRLKNGGKQEKMRNTKIKEIGPYPAIFKNGDDQRMVFCEDDEGPFNLSFNHLEDRRFDGPKGGKKIATKLKKELKKELKLRGYFVRGHCRREELEQVTEKYKIELTNEVYLVEEG